MTVTYFDKSLFRRNLLELGKKTMNKLKSNNRNGEVYEKEKY